jgi:hypothetical protein
LNIEESGAAPAVPKKGWLYWPQAVVCVVILLVAGLWCSWSGGGDWVVRINGAPVTKTEWQQETDRYETSMYSLYGVNPKAPGNEKIDRMISQEMLQQLEDQELLLQAAARAGITASPVDIEGRVLMDTMSVGGTDQLQQALAAQGYTMAEYRRQIAEMVTVTKLSDYVTRNVTVSEAELRAAYQSNQGQQQLSFARAHDQLQQQVLASKKNAVFLAYLNGLWENSLVEYRMPATKV